jgi:hypothetical protein
MGPIVSFVLIAAMSTGMQLRLYIRCQALVYSRQAPDSVAMPPDLRQRIIGLKHITVDRSIPRTRRMHAETVGDQDHGFGCGSDSPRMGLARGPTTLGVTLFSIGTSVAGAHYHEHEGGRRSLARRCRGPGVESLDDPSKLTRRNTTAHAPMFARCRNARRDNIAQ